MSSQAYCLQLLPCFNGLVILKRLESAIMSIGVLIAGTGYAGIEAALTLNKMQRRGELEITLIEKKPVPYFAYRVA